MLPNTLEPQEMSGSITLIWMIWHLLGVPRSLTMVEISAIS